MSNMASNIIEHSAFADYYSHAAPLETRFLECIQIKKDYFYVFGLEQLGYLVLHSERKQIDTGLSANLERQKHKLDFMLGSDDHNFVLYQQSIQSVSSNHKSDHHEILLRVTAERYGKICEIDLWVLKETLGYLKNHPDQSMNANLSGITLCNEHARNTIYELIRNHPEVSH